MLKGGSILRMCAKRARKFRSHAHFCLKPRPFSIVLERNLVNGPVFDRDFLLKHAKVSHRNSFLSSLAREGGST